MNIKLAKATAIIVVVGTMAGAFISAIGIESLGIFAVYMLLGVCLTGAVLAFKLHNDVEIQEGRELLIDKIVDYKKSPLALKNEHKSRIAANKRKAARAKK